MSDPAEQARRRRNIFLAFALLAFVALVFVITLVRIQHGIAVGRQF
jgi:hypothetical protein